MASEVIATMSIKTVWSGLNHNTLTTADLPVTCLWFLSYAQSS